ncbi:putative acyl esterase [Coleophoma cylindrospora]|uniref:Putative acyl esterase n=1 Tax=Coleophoma cylindrospora TaxID=1849047 RepID=A0A3D8R734_9HELO|nr:putative acyl esterase [Coleophoma cylindrospora]
MPPPVQVALQPIDKPSIGRNNYQQFNPREEILPAGWNGYHSRPLSCDIHVSHDVALRVRDGCTLYCDIYRPARAKEPVSAIVAWSPYGKKFNGITMLKNLPWGLGIPNGVLSGLEKFEGPDPAILCDRGFAVVNVDSRGCGDSEGTIAIMGSQEAEDGYDVIEALAKMPWCSGSIGMAGNSHLAIVQWFIAALKPPSLKAIAPWEACGDLYREQFVRGGIFDAGLFDFIIKTNIQGNFAIEDFKAMYARSATADGLYWKDKRPDIDKIQIPTFISASYSSFVHTMGSIRGWLQVDTPHKWFRICPWQEWYDIWNCEESIDEMVGFFDRFLNGKDNDFEQTPRVRISYLKFSGEPIYDIVEDDYPIPRTKYTKLFFTPENGLEFSPPPEAKIVTYNSEKYLDCASFTYRFPETTRLAGLPKAVLYLSTPDSKDMDIYVVLRKLDRNGKMLVNLNIPWSSVASQGVFPDKIDEIPRRNMNNLMFHGGSLGMLRASRRAIDPTRSLHENYPFHPHDKDEYLKPGEIVKLEVGIWAMGVEYDEGESIRVEVHGTNPSLRGEFAIDNPFAHLASRGMHRVHTGGDFASYVVLPFV